jgi:hypothetical protein
LAVLLGWLADAEKAHAKWFLRLNKTVRIERKDPDVEKMGKALLSDARRKSYPAFAGFSEKRNHRGFIRISKSLIIDIDRRVLEQI